MGTRNTKGRVSSLVFARRRTTKNIQRQKKSIRISWKMLAYIFLIGFFAAGSVYAGHFIARGGTLDFRDAKAVREVVHPIAQSIDKKESTMDLLEKQGIEFDEISLATTSSALIITLEKNSYVYLNSSEDIESQIKVLSNILLRIGIENPGKKVHYIDLRYYRPIVKL